MQRHAKQTIFVLLVAGATVVAAILHPSFFIANNNPVASLAAETSTVNQPPLLVLPSLSADVGAGNVSPTGTSVAAVTNSLSSTTAKISKVPNVGAEIELVADLETSKYFLNVNADERWPMASISKLMTAAVAIDVLNPGDHITITEPMIAVDPTQQILHLGDSYTVSDLLRIMLLPSNNVAAEALADFSGRTQFLAAMNAKAALWGMSSTYYDDPSGLSAANESSASDLLKLAQHIYAEYPQILAVTRTPQVTVQNLSTGQSVIIKSINDFAGQADFLGGKTGYTDQADGNLLSIFDYRGEPICIVVLGIDDGVRFNATQGLYTWFKENF